MFNGSAIYRLFDIWSNSGEEITILLTINGSETTEPKITIDN